MDGLLRGVAIFIEVAILAGIMYALVTGVGLAILDLGVGAKYGKPLRGVLLIVAGIATVFFIAHLTAFYPVPGG